MTTKQSVAYDRLLEEKPELSYADITELRSLCREAIATQEMLAREDAMIAEEKKSCGFLFETADGLRCWFRGEIPAGLGFYKRAVRRSEIRSFRIPPNDEPPVLENLPVRLYRFEKFMGGVFERTAVFKEVVQ